MRTGRPHKPTTMTDVSSRNFVKSRDILDYIIDQGVDINRTNHKILDGGFRLAGRECLQQEGTLDFSLKVLNGVAARGDIELFDHLVSRGADPQRSMALHCASRCKDAEKSTGVIDHLLDQHRLDIELDSMTLRKYPDTTGDCGTPLECAIFHQNLAAVNKLLERGAKAKNAAVQHAIGFTDDYGYLSALFPLLDAGADVEKAFDWAVNWGNLAAARICLEGGADPTRVLEEHCALDERRAARRSAWEKDREDGDASDDFDSEGEETRFRYFDNGEKEERAAFLKSVSDARSFYQRQDIS